MYFRPACLALALLALPSLPAAAQTPTTAREIAALMAALERSGCEFNRNGRWHDAAQAREHLQRKYDYLQRKRLVGTTEAFIDQAAARSSMTGTPYRVRCGRAAAVESRTWLLEQLARLRAQRPSA